VGGKDASDRPLRFTEGWFGSLDVLYDVALRNLKVNGILQALGSTNDIGQTTAKWRNLYLSGAVNAATMALSGNATVGGTLGITGALTASTINTGQGATEVYKETYEYASATNTTYTLASMLVGETKRVYAKLIAQYDGTVTLNLPSGGVYSVDGVILSGGATIFTKTEEYAPRTYEMGIIVWRIS
jgi:hypothetical protein